VGLHRPDPALCIGIQVRAARRQHQRFDARPDAMIARKDWLYLLSRSWSLFDYLPAEQSGQMRAEAAQNGNRHAFKAWMCCAR
jgi:hypothetical protein